VKVHPSRLLISYWPSYEESIKELALLTQSFEGLVIENAQILRKLRRMRDGQARYRKDFKKLVAFQEESLWEVRWDIDSFSGSIPVRLILSELHTGDLLLLKWHVKNPKMPQEGQRAAQNQACREAVKRKGEIYGKYKLDL
jgi:hypothetical protein